MSFDLNKMYEDMDERWTDALLNGAKKALKHSKLVQAPPALPQNPNGPSADQEPKNTRPSEK